MKLKLFNRGSDEAEISYKLPSYTLGPQAVEGNTFTVRAQSPKKAYELFLKIKKDLEKE